VIFAFGVLVWLLLVAAIVLTLVLYGRGEDRSGDDLF
jgi:hypothetical protein